MTRFLVNWLKKRWQGPAISVELAGAIHRVGQGEPTTTIVVHKPQALSGMWHSPSLVFGEAYMRGFVEIRGSFENLMQGFFESRDIIPAVVLRLRKLLSRMPISVGRAHRNAQHHYDIGNDFYALWLGRSRTYSCAYFLNESDTIDQAQWQKNELLCRKVRLDQGMRVLDIGAGWGGFAFHAAEKYGAHVTGITPAKEQAAYIDAEAKRRGLSDKVSVITDDWRSLTGTYDRVVSVGMFEHVGARQYAAFFNLWRSLLAADGISLLHTIGRSRPGGTDPWIDKYIFPGGYLPTLDEISKHSAAVGLPIIDVENLQQHYAKTLEWWAKNFEEQKERVTAMFDEQFVRMWRLYLRSVQAGFQYGDIQLYQVVMPGPNAVWPLNREVATEHMHAPERVE